MNTPYDLKLFYLENGNIRATWEYLPSGQLTLFAVNVYINGIMNQNLSQLYVMEQYLDILLPHSVGSYTFTVRANDTVDLGPISSLSNSVTFPQTTQIESISRSYIRLWMLLLWTLFILLLMYSSFGIVRSAFAYSKEMKSHGQLYSWKLNPSLNKFFAF